jgi:hypothetical protein
MVGNQQQKPLAHMLVQMIPTLNKLACIINAGFAGYLIYKSGEYADRQCKASFVTTLFWTGCFVCAFSLWWVAIASIGSVLGDENWTLKMTKPIKLRVGLVSIFLQYASLGCVCWCVIVGWAADAQECDKALYDVGQTATYWYSLWGVVHCLWKPFVMCIIFRSAANTARSHAALDS